MSEDTPKTVETAQKPSEISSAEDNDILSAVADAVPLPDSFNATPKTSEQTENAPLTEDSNPLMGMDTTEIPASSTSLHSGIEEDYVIEGDDGFVFSGHGDDRLHTEDDPTPPSSQAEQPQTDIFQGVESSTMAQADSSQDQLVGGTGEDTFIYDIGDVSLGDTTGEDNLAIFDSSVDLGNLNPVSNESLNLDQALDDFLTLSSEDVINMSDDHHLTITGDAKDVINLEGEWSKEDSIDGFTNYTSGDASISIENTIVDAGGVNII